MKQKKKKLRITEDDYVLANRRAARAEEIAQHGRQISLRRSVHKSKKVYDRNALKRQAHKGLPFLRQMFPRKHIFIFLVAKP